MNDYSDTQCSNEPTTSKLTYRFGLIAALVICASLILPAQTPDSSDQPDNSVTYVPYLPGAPRNAWDDDTTEAIDKSALEQGPTTEAPKQPGFMDQHGDTVKRIALPNHYLEAGLGFFFFENPVKTDALFDGWGGAVYAGYRFRFTDRRVWGFTPELGGRFMRGGHSGFDGNFSSISSSIDIGSFFFLQIKPSVDIGICVGKIEKTGIDPDTENVALFFSRISIDAGFNILQHGGLALNVSYIACGNKDYKYEDPDSPGDYLSDTMSPRGVIIGLMVFIQI